jgi:hypothetical protein
LRIVSEQHIWRGVWTARHRDAPSKTRNLLRFV